MNKILDKGIALHKAGRFEEAQEVYKSILDEYPSNFEAISLLGSLNLQLKKYSEAEKYTIKAININPQYFGSYINLGAIYLKKENYLLAIKNFSKAIELNPHSAEGFNNLAIAQKKNYLFDDALTNYQTAIKLKPDYSEAYNNLGLLFRDFGKLKEAIDEFNKAIRLNSKYIDAIRNKAITYFTLNNFNLAIKEYNNLKILDKQNYLIYYFEILFIEAHICCWKNYKKLLLGIKKKILSNKYICEPFKLLLHNDSPELISCNTEALNKKEFKGINTSDIKNTNKRNKKIKIAYYSADLREHAVGNLLLTIVENHDLEKFEIINFYFQRHKIDEITTKIAGASKNFINAGRLSDEEIISKSLDLKIDIAVDLMGYTAHNRAKIFVKRVAPAQVNFMGYPCTIGNHIDYIISDKNSLPTSNQKFYYEKIIHLKNFFLPPINLLKNDFNNYTVKHSNITENKFIYCCFSSNYKINEEIFNCWMEILKETPNSVLSLLEGNNETRNNLIIEANKKGIGSDRIIFNPMVSYSKRFEKFSHCDVFLDTYPYGSHSTAIETLSNFVPIITLEGNSFQSRICSSLLRNLNLSELVKINLKEYKDLAIQLYLDPTRLKKIKQKLHYELFNNPTFNKKIYTKNLENAYLKIYDNIKNNVI